VAFCSLPPPRYKNMCRFSGKAKLARANSFELIYRSFEIICEGVASAF